MIWRFPVFFGRRPLQPSWWRLRKALSLFFVLQTSLVSVSTTAGIATDQQCTAAASPKKYKYHHMVVLVHGYMGSYREQEYFGEALLAESRKVLENGSSDTCSQNDHQFSILYSKANQNHSTDGVVKGGERLAAEISEWIQELTGGLSSTESTVMTLSVIGNSLGGLYSRYALTELDVFKTDENNGILPLIFCTTSSPHLGVSQETFIELPKWTEPYVSSVFRQQTMDDLFGVNESTVVMDMCNRNNAEGRSPPSRDFLAPLEQFQKRIAVANAYNTDFLVSVSSGAFLSSASDSVHHHQDSDVVSRASIRLMKDTEHVALQVATQTEEHSHSIGTSDDDDETTTTTNCVNALDKLGWHKIFIDTRSILPSVFNLETPPLEPKASYTSKELQDHFKRYGTLMPVAHPLNMANSKTDWYRKLTQSGQPIVDALAELVVLDMIELSEQQQQQSGKIKEDQ